MSKYLPNAAAAAGLQDGGGESSLLQPPTIVPMETNSIRRIVAGQAVTDLASAVKELVDNALDAGATGINIRLWNSGAKILEVSDDGCGIPLASRPYIAMKNATSKIRSFEDIYGGANTLGFRGEALFCLANISQQLLVCTRTASDELGQRLSFGRDGYLDPESVCQAPRKIGTTVAVVGLFDALPVRKADMIKRMKKQRAKLLKMMQGYAVLCTGVRFNLMDMVGPGNRENAILATSAGNNSLEQTISSVLGSRFLSGLTRFSVDLTTAVAGENVTESIWKVEGLVSKAPILSGRGGAPSREVQFFSINHRPVELPKISRALGDAWRALEKTNTKRPACALCFTLPTNAYDVNLSPDKRDVFLRDDAAICELIREAVTALWSSQSDGTFAANEVELLSQKQNPTASVPSPAVSSPASDGTPGRRRARRRMAFVHDLSNATMQHEGGDRMESMQGTVLRDELDFAQQSGSSQLESFSSASPGVSEESSEAEETAGKNRATQPTEDRPAEGASRLDRASDRERIKWSQTQLQFNQVSAGERQSQEDEINLLEDANERRSLNQQDGNEAAPGSPSVDNVEGKMIVSDGQRGSRINRSSNHGKQVMGLEQFAFAPLEQNTCAVPPSHGRPKRKADSIEHDTQHARENRRSTRTTPKAPSSLGSLGSCNSSVVTPPDPCDETVARRVDSTRQNATPAGVKQDARQSQSSNRADENDVQMECSGVDSSSEDSPVKPRKLQRRNFNMDSGAKEATDRPPVVWDSFQGTDQIVQAAKLARLSIRKQRKQLQNDTKSRDDTGNGIDETVNVENVDDQSRSNDHGMVRLNKEVFKDMEIIGQFNLGFILARCRNNHLWILDQHACDEKYNFERLCVETVIHEQKLIAPLSLELSPSEESCIMDNMEVFEQNGFRFSYDSEKPPRHRLALTALPHSGAPDGRKAVQFGKEDVTALCAMLEADGDSYAESGGGYGNNAVRRYAGGHSQLGKASQHSAGNDTDEEKRARKIITRLPKAIAMFASRACRGSIMIGTALSQKEMDAIVKKLAKVDNPWNCPHGRPTMRHVRDLAPTLLEEEKKAELHVAGPTLAVMSQFQEVDSIEEGDR